MTRLEEAQSIISNAGGDPNVLTGTYTANKNTINESTTNSTVSKDSVVTESTIGTVGNNSIANDIINENTTKRKVRLVGTKLRQQILSNDKDATADHTLMTNNKSITDPSGEVTSSALNEMITEALIMSSNEGLPINECLGQVLQLPTGFTKILTESNELLAYVENQGTNGYTILPTDKVPLQEGLRTRCTTGEELLESLSKLTVK